MSSIAASPVLAGTTARLETIHRRQVHRDGWPDFAAFDVAKYPAELRRASARQWTRRAREELGSVHEFTALTHVLARARAPIEILGALSRLITDEVRHVEICARMGAAVWPEGDLGIELTTPRFPYPEPPAGIDEQTLYRWSAEMILSACCIGETVSRPLFESVATVCTDPVCESVIRQILRDEHLHATFGWEAFGWLFARLDVPSREWIQERLSVRLAAYEKTSSGGHSLDDLAGTEVVIERDPAVPNLGTLTSLQYATIFYATVESEILPRFTEIGLDAARAWSSRPR